MKKIIIAACLMIATSSALSAQTTKPGSGTPGTNKNNSGYTDANNNKICDNYENRTRAFYGQRQPASKGNGSGYGKGNGRCNTTQGFKAGNRRNAW